MWQKHKRKIFKFISLLKIPVILVIVVFFGVITYRLTNPLLSFCLKNRITVPFIWNLVVKGIYPLKSSEGRTNILVLGIGGGNHEGSDLTDTILVLSADISKKDILVLSIPRDLWIDSMKDRINTAYHYGEVKKQGGGLVMTKSVMEEVIDIPIHYAAVIDFSGFKRLIDVLGGIEIYIPETFQDDKYPIEGKENDTCNGDRQYSCRYEQVKFEKGWRHMDGETALKYTRSRYSGGDEGTDFARNKRQQDMILAVRDKMKTLSLMQDREKISALFRLVDQMVISDMDWSEKISLLNLVRTNRSDIRRLSLDWGNPAHGKAGYLINPPTDKYNGAWVLIPRTGNYTEIHTYVSCHLSDPACSQNP